MHTAQRDAAAPAIRPPLLRAVAVAAAALILAHLLDGLAFRYLRIDDVYGSDPGRLLRVMGFAPTWLIAATALALHAQIPVRRLMRSAAGLLALAPALGGIFAELVKLLVRRGRPGELGEYVFRAYTERPLSTGGLGFASSHAGVAFAAAFALSRIFPRAWIVWWSLAWGCGLTRVAAGAHFLSDVVGAAVLGWLAGWLVWRWTRGVPGGPHAVLAQRGSAAVI
jgi:membrane-associated phospholipid phosphatase